MDEIKSRMTERDFIRWIAFKSLKAEEQKAAMEKARQDAKKGR